MTKQSANLLFWTPRIICILFACFVSIFALDVFAEGYSFWETVFAFVMHQIPTLLVVVILLIAWRWEWVGGLLFVALGVFYIVMSWGRFPITNYIIMAGPLFLVGVLFFLNWRYKDEIRAQRLGPAE